MKTYRILFSMILFLPLVAFTQSWGVQNSNLAVSRGITDMVAVNADIVWAAAYDGAAPTNACQNFTRTVNGGVLWTAGNITGATGTSIANITAIDGNIGWAATYYNSGSGANDGIWFTSNGGVTWTHQTSASFSNSASFPNGVWFWDANNGYCFGDPINGEFEIYTTTNGGVTWTLVPGANIPNPLSGEFGIMSYQSVVGNTIWFGTNKGRIYKSTNRGMNWTVATCTPMNNQYIEPCFKDQNYGLIMDKGSGSTGTLAYTNDGGLTFALRNNFGHTFTNDMAYVPGTTSTWVSTGSDVSFGLAGTSYSLDDGVNWIDMPGTFGTPFLSTSWVNNTTGWAGSFVDANGLGGMYVFQGTLGESVTTTSPNGGESWLIGSVHPITWSSAGVSNVKIEYSTNNGTSWNMIIASYPASGGSYSWTVPNSPSTQCKVKISSASNSSVFDLSDNTFTISASSQSITVLSPNGGENWLVGSTQSITWTSSGVTNIMIQYSIDNGASWIAIVNSYPAATGSYSWNIANTPSIQCKVRISDESNASFFDMSDSPFTISINNQSIVVALPNGGEVLQVGSIYTITWTSSGVNNIKIDYTTDNGASWTTIINSYPASGGSYSWIIPNTPSNQCKVRITDSGNASLFDMSDNLFTISTITQSITVTNPNGGEIWQVGSIQNITWTSIGITTLKIEYSTNNGASWNIINASFPANTGYYPWAIPNTQSTQCKVRITDSGNGSLWDMSDNPFTISTGGQSTPEICIVSVDNTTNNNLIVWEKPYSTTIDHYNIYVESNQANVYTLIGSVPYNSFSTFTDPSSNPLQQAYRYKISLVDINNNETSLSDEQRTIHLTINQGMGNSFNLLWNNYEGFSFPSLNIYRGTSPTTMTLLATVASSMNSFTDLYPPSGYVYYQIEVVKPVPCTPSKISIGSSLSNISSNDPSLSSDSKPANNISIVLFPNPTTGLLKVKSNQVIHKVEIFNSMGVLVQKYQEHLIENTFDLSTLLKGVYYFKMYIGNQTEVRKVIVL